MRIAIIGAGPAGIACAVQLKRMGWEADIFEKERVGGLLHNAGVIHNYIGFPDGIRSTDIIEKLEKYVLNYNVKIIFEEIIMLDYAEDEYKLATKNNLYTYNIIVVASGTKPNTVNWSEKYPDKIFYEIKKIRDIENKSISIIGAGDAAFDYALQLHSKSNISIFNRTNRHKCLKSLHDEVMEKQNIKYHSNYELHNIDLQDDKLYLSFNCEEKKSIHITDYLIFAVGRKANRAFIDEHIAEDEQDKLVDTRRLYFAGDVCRGDYRQLSIAGGDGVRTAMEINQLLRTNNK